MHLYENFPQFHPIIILFVLFLGLSLGSFVTLAIYRIPRKLPIVAGRSKCPKCKNTLTVLDLFPLFSWVLLKGRCRHCGTGIGVFYPTIEIITGILVMIAYGVYGVDIITGVLMLYIVGLMIMSGIAIDHHNVPYSVYAYLGVIGILHLCLEGNIYGIAWLSAPICGVFIGFLLERYSVWRKLEKGFAKEDIIFLGIAGFYLDIYTFPSYLFLCSVMSILTMYTWCIMDRGDKFPYRPALGIALFMCLTWNGARNVMNIILDSIV